MGLLADGGTQRVVAEDAVEGLGEALRRAMLDEDPAFRQLWLEERQAWSMAIGFRDDRAAEVTRLEWVDPVPSAADRRWEEVRVTVALDGPAGPWRDLGTWTLTRGGDGSVAPFDLPEGTWARFIRLDADGPRQAGPWDPPTGDPCRS